MAKQIEATFGIDPSEILHVSAKTGEGALSVLEAIVERVPPPKGDIHGPLSAFLFDSSFVCLDLCNVLPLTTL